MRACIPLSISRILGTTLLMFLLLGILQGLYSYDAAKRKDAERLERIERVRELQWALVETVIADNYNLAELFANDIKGHVESKLITAYPDKSLLRNDLDNPDPNAMAFSIFTQEVRGRFLNGIKNDNNDPFIASRNGVLSDLSLNCSEGESPIRSWEKEISLHANKVLAAKAIHAINTQSNKPIFWEFLPAQTNDHELITEMELASIKAVFMREGLEGLKTYEFLKPVYIRQYDDILGMADVNNLGVRQLNYKLIVVSGFNIYDILMTYHKPAITSYDTIIKIINRDYLDMTRDANFFHAIVTVVTLFCIIVTAVINNYVVTLMRKEDGDDDAATCAVVSRSE